MKKLPALAILFIFFLAPSVVLCQDIEGRKLKIGIRESPPFIICNDSIYSGLSIDLWETIAPELGLDFEYVPYKDLGNLVEDIGGNKIDLSINPLTVTSERLKQFAFSQPFYISGLAIAVKVKSNNTWFLFLKNLFSRQFIEVIVLLMAVITIFGFILWLVERKANHHQFRKGWRGLGDGIWWSAVTMTTVGYGDKSPVSPLGRIISIIWMFTAVIIISSFTASISAALTYNKFQANIKNMEDLRNVSVGTVVNSSSAEFLHDKKIRFKSYNTLQEAVEDLNVEKLHAVVYDEPLLSYQINENNYNDQIKLISSGVNSLYFSFASADDDFLKELNPSLIRTIEGPHWRKWLAKYKLHAD